MTTDELTHRAGLVARAAEELAAERPERARLVARLAAEGGWSTEMADWIVDATFTPLRDEGRVLDWARQGGASANRDGHTVVIAGGAIPDPIVRALAAGFLLGNTLELKCSAREPVMSAAFADVLARSSGFTIPVHRFRGGDGGHEEEAMFERATRLVAFGHRETIRSLRGRSREGCLVLAHGPRTSVAIVLDAYADEQLEQLALDVARYDQAGCLSPQAVLVQGDLEERTRVIDRLGAALDRLALELPPGRGLLESEAAWRLHSDRVLLDAIARAPTGRRFDRTRFHTDGESYLVHASREQPIELSPGGRIVSVTALADVRTESARALGQAAELIQGVAVVGADPADWVGFLDAERVTAAGELQCPPLEFAPDGICAFAT